MEKKEPKRPHQTESFKRKEMRKKKKDDSVVLPFAEEKKLFKKRNFFRQYRIFRRGGLNVFDCFFNTLYIMMSEKSVEKEKKKLEKMGEKEHHPRHFLDLHAPHLRVLSAFAVKIYSFFAYSASFWHKRDGSHVHRSKMIFVREHLAHITVSFLAIAIFSYIAVILHFPLVLRAEIDGKVLGIVEDKNTVDSAINELEDNVEFILGKNFSFPYEIRYTFQRQKIDTITPKNKISEQLYTYVQNFVCTAGGLYVDDVLVAVCQDADTVQNAISDFVSQRAEGAEEGIFNEIRVVTQAYPTESIISQEQLFRLLCEMEKPLEDREKDILPEDTVLPGFFPDEDKEETLPAFSLISDLEIPKKDQVISKSNQPQPIDEIKLDFYTSKEYSYEATVPFKTLYVESDEHYTSMADETTKGVNGRASVTAKVYYVDGKEVGREVVREEVLSQPVDRVISIGTKVLPEDLKSETLDKRRFIVPFVGTVYSYYGPREDGYHYGWDIPGDEGDNLYAAASGKVIVAIGQDGYFSDLPEHHFTGYGYCVVIEHEDGYSTMYAHCNKIYVALGQEVKQGDKIAEIGNTGKSEGNHVHFEIMKNGAKLNPAQYLYEGKTTIYD